MSDTTEELAERIEARDFTYCSATYHDPLRFQKFLVWTPYIVEARPRALAYARATWGEPSKIHHYPRTYVREARELLAAGRYESDENPRLNLAEAQELHEAIGAAIEAGDTSRLVRARELAAILVSDILSIEEVSR